MSHRGWIGSLFLATLAWGQAVKPSAPPAPPKAPAASQAAAAKVPEGAAVSPDAAVITIPGLCEKPSLDKSKPADCKTVVTRAEFEHLVEAVAPTIAPPARKQLATQYGIALVMVHKAHQMGLDKGPRFEELMRVARVGVLTKELSQKLQDEAGRVSDQDVASYYHKNEAAFQEADLQRIFIPRTKQPAEKDNDKGKDKDKDKDKDKTGSDEAKKTQQDSEEAMKKEAAAIRERAAAGEDFDKLQDEAAAAAEFKGKPPTKLGKVRRSSLPPTQAEVMDLKPGETSQLITTPNGYLIYKAGERDTLPLEKVHDEIVSTLRSQRIQDAMQAIQKSATPELNEKYFAEASPADAQAAPPAKSPESGPK